MTAEVQVSFQEMCILRWMYEDAGNQCLWKIAAAEGIGVPVSGEFSISNHFIYTTLSECRALTLPAHIAWLFTKYAVNMK